MLGFYKTIKQGIKFSFDGKVFVPSFIFFFSLYSFILPATYTGGRVGLVSLKMLTPALTLFAFVFSILIAFIIIMNVRLYKSGKESNGSSAFLGVFGGILPPLLCCSPVIPSLVASFGAVIPGLSSLSGLQGFIAVYETEIYLAVVVLLLYALYASAKSVVNCPECKG